LWVRKLECRHVPVPPIYWQDLTGDVRRRVTEQKDRRVRDILDVTDTT